MLGIFLESAGMTVGEGMTVAGFLAIGAVFLFLYLLLIAGLYIFTALMFRSLAKKAGDSSPNLAWIPGVGPLIIAFRASKMHWWPWLLLIGIIIPLVGLVAMIVFMVFEFIWMWKLFEAVGRPGWWVFLLLIPIVGIVMLAIAAWGNVGKSAVAPAPVAVPVKAPVKKPVEVAKE